jgi:hypothetical protein
MFIFIIIPAVIFLGVLLVLLPALLPCAIVGTVAVVASHAVQRRQDRQQAAKLH